MKSQCVSQLRFPFYQKRSLYVEFGGGRISSDGGLVLVRQVDEREGISQAAATCLRDWRDPLRIEYPLLDLVRQRVYQIALVTMIGVTRSATTRRRGATTRSSR